MTTQFACSGFVGINDIYDTECGCNLQEGDDDILVQAMIDQASDMLSLATGGIISGICQVKVRPVYLETGPSYLSRFDRVGYVSRFADFDHRRRFGGLNSIPLRGPRTDIVRILIDGTQLNLTEYVLLNDRFLVRKSGSWPENNDLTLDEFQKNTFMVEYRFGRPADKLTFMATIELTCELLKDITGRPSGLPRGVQSASIQGASVTIKDRAEALREGGEQIPVVARFLSVYAYDGPNQVSSVWSPELEQSWSLIEFEGPSGS